MFFVQPLVAKAVLPAFGGTAAVWTGVMLFFQLGLVAGYGIAHLLKKAYGWKLFGLYVTLVVVGIGSAQMGLLLEVEPGSYPMLSLQVSLLTSVGAAFLLLGATTPVLQVLCHRLVGKEPYWLYGISNVSSFLALLSFPVIFESKMTLPELMSLWKWGLVILGVSLTSLILIQLIRDGGKLSDDTRAADSGPKMEAKKWDIRWLIYPFLASVALLSFTVHLTTDVAPVPLLWVMPLSVYLLSFVLVFSRWPFYSERWVPVLCLLACCVQAFPYFGWGQGMSLVVIPVSLMNLFVICWFCHGRLIESRPAPEFLTRFYLALSVGGAAGGVFCGIAAPIVFAGPYEYLLVLFLVAAVALLGCLSGKEALFAGGELSLPFRLLKTVPITLMGFILMFHFMWFMNEDETILVKERNFYSSIHIRESERTIDMVSGRVVHGIQLKQKGGAQIPTAYYHPESAMGCIFRYLNEREQWNVGVVGLGVGTVASYMREQDHMVFFEIDPKVVRLAEEHFDFMGKARGTVEMHIADGRNGLSVMTEANLDALVVDAFTGDSVPVHMLTSEAFEEFIRYLKPDGLLVFHISNNHLELQRLMAGIATEKNWKLLIVDSPAFEPAGNPNQYAVLSANEFSAEIFDGAGRTVRDLSDITNGVLWTDHYSNLFRILKYK